MNKPEADSFATALAFTLWIAAARADARSSQLIRLNRQLRPLLEEYRRTGDELPVRRATQEIMGAQWAPSGDWAKRLATLKKS